MEVASTQPGRSSADDPPPVCVSCGAALHGFYCHVCGERVVRPADLRLARFLAETLSATFDVDARPWRTLRTMIRRPGRLTADYVRGHRRPYLSPLQTFLLANLVFFFSLGTIGGVDAFTTPLEVHQTQPLYGPTAARLTGQQGAPGSTERAEYQRRFDEASPRYANTLVILLVPFYALGLSLLYAAARRPAAVHVVHALYFIAVVLLVMAVLPLALLPLMAVSPWIRAFLTRNETPVTLLVFVLLWSYLALSFREAYGTARWRAVASGLLGVLLLAPVIILYRALLFFVVHAAVAGA